MHRGFVEDVFSANILKENYYGTVAVYFGNYDEGTTYYSVIFSNNAYDLEYYEYEDGCRISSNCPEEYKDMVLNGIVYDDIENNKQSDKKASKGVFLFYHIYNLVMFFF